MNQLWLVLFILSTLNHFSLHSAAADAKKAEAVSLLNLSQQQAAGSASAATAEAGKQQLMGAEEKAVNVQFNCIGKINDYFLMKPDVVNGNVIDPYQESLARNIFAQKYGKIIFVCGSTDAKKIVLRVYKKGINPFYVQRCEWFGTVECLLCENGSFSSMVYLSGHRSTAAECRYLAEEYLKTIGYTNKIKMVSSGCIIC